MIVSCSADCSVARLETHVVTSVGSLAV